MNPIQLRLCGRIAECGNPIPELLPLSGKFHVRGRELAGAIYDLGSQLRFTYSSACGRSIHPGRGGAGSFSQARASASCFGQLSTSSFG
ncbi:MAG TPA: hypothetical protein VIU43_07700 [Nitrosospira sp.]